VGFPIRRFLDQSSFAAPQDFSQRTTSFIASQRQGIHQMLLRHLITLMIDVRSAKTGHDRKKDLSSDFSKDFFCLPSISGAPGCGPGLVRGTRWPAGRICCLFTISNIRASPQGEARTSDKIQSASRSMDTGYVLLNRSQENGGACRDRTDDLKLAKLPLSQLS
jgi:hypothetical protein